VAGQEKKPLILVWTRIFQEQSLKLESDCPLYDQCLITYDHGLFQQSNAVVFHVADIKWVHQLKPAQLAYDLPDIPDIPPFNKTKLNVFMSQENPTTLARLYMLKELQKKSIYIFYNKKFRVTRKITKLILIKLEIHGLSHGIALNKWET
jgi:hypothetical protein